MITTIYNVNGESIYGPSVETSNCLHGYMRIFHKVAVFGDSLSVGKLCTPDDYVGVSAPNYSWMANIARKYNNEYKLYARSGDTSKQCYNRWKTQFEADETTYSAFYICLGTNDRGTKQYPLGEITDEAGTDSTVGYFKAIIDMCLANNPNAAIFLGSMYNFTRMLGTSEHETYWDMISDIADLYDNCFYMDFRTVTSDAGSYIYNGHFTTFEYCLVADAIEELTENIILSNTRFFSDFGNMNKDI